MAFFDWNHDGKKDWQDNFIEYHIYEEQKNNKPPVSTGGGNGMSTFGAILSMVVGFVLQALVYMVFGIDVKNVPVPVMIILWIFFSAIVAAAVSKMGL